MRPWHAIGLFCEDIRHEKNGMSLMAIWPDNVNVAAIPGTLARLATYVRVHLDPTANAGPILAKVRFPDGSEHPMGEFDADAVKKTQKTSEEAGTPYAGFMLSGIAFGFPITEAGRVLLIVKVGDEEAVCGSLNIQLTTEAPNPSAISLGQPA